MLVSGVQQNCTPVFILVQIIFPLRLLYNIEPTRTYCIARETLLDIMSHADVWQEAMQFCKAFIFQLKNKLIFKNIM